MQAHVADCNLAGDLHETNVISGDCARDAANAALATTDHPLPAAIHCLLDLTDYVSKRWAASMWSAASFAYDKT